jgi:MraZ protein
MFNGTYRNRIEEKGRVAIPFRFRNLLSPKADGTLVITRGYDGCLSLYPLDKWREFEEKLSKLPTADKRARILTRWFSSNAERVKIDRQGRIKIPQYLLDFAGLNKEAVITGALNRVEIWNPESYAKQNMEADPSEMENIEGLDI